MNYPAIPDLIIFSGAFFALVLSLSQLLLRERRAQNIFLALLFFCYGIFQVSNSFVLFYASRDWYHAYQVVYPLGLTFFFFIGPLQYIYFRGIIRPGEKVRVTFYMHFLPGIAFAVLMALNHPGAPDYSIGPEKYLQYLREVYPLYVLTSFAGVISFAVYMGIFLKQVFPSLFLPIVGHEVQHL